MIESAWKRRMAVAAVAAGWAAALAGCASSSDQRSPDSEAATSSETTGESTTSGDERERGKRDRAEVRKQVDFEKILGSEIRGGTPPGCTGEWSKLERTSFPGEGYTCTEFNGPDDWEDLPVTMVIEEGKLSVIVLQRFFEGPDGASGAYDSVTGELLGRCDRKTGFDRSMVLDCDDYVVDVRWRPSHDRATLKVIYARSWKILKQGR